MLLSSSLGVNGPETIIPAWRSNYYIAGMEMMFNKFQVIVTQMKKKPYDYLDQRKMEFDSDFEDFKRQINDLHVSEIYFI